MNNICPDYLKKLSCRLLTYHEEEEEEEEEEVYLQISVSQYWLM